MTAPVLDPPVLEGRLAALLARSGLAPLRLAGRTLLPLVQGGMGVGVSAHRLAGAVAAEGGVGTISSVDLRHHHPDLMERTGKLPPGDAAKQAIDAANLEAITREITAAREVSGGRGLLAINVMRAVNAYAASVRQALEAGIDAVVVGAGLPLDLPDLAQDHPRAALVPILSDARGVQLVVKKWERKKRLPDAIVIEHPRLAGGHLGAARIADLNDPRFEFENVIPQSLAFLRAAGIEQWGAFNSALYGLGQRDLVGCPGAGVEPGGDGVEHGRADLPARAVATRWMRSYLRMDEKLQSVARKRACMMSFDCLAQCGLRDGTPGWGQFCIDHQLVAALQGNVKMGLFFRGVGALPFGNQIRSVRELIERLLTPNSTPAAPLPA